MPAISFLLIITLLCTHGFCLNKNLDAGALPSDIAGFLKIFIHDTGPSVKTPNGEELIYTSAMLTRFYEKRDYYPAWSDNNGLLDRAETLVKAIENTGSHGLVPEFYHLESINSLIRKNRIHKTGMSPNPEILAGLDILLTDAFLILGCHLSAGCVDPVTIEAEWFTSREDLYVDLALEKALEKNSIEDALSELLPRQEVYSKLRLALTHYRAIADNGGWPQVPDGPLLEKGNQDKRVINLIERLSVTDKVKYAKKKNRELFDEKLEQTLIMFQKRHGLETDGVVGPDTISAMNIPVEKRIRQIELNLERLRWISRISDQRYITVNIADFKLDLIENSRSVLSMKVIVGKPYWHTPVFSKKMDYLVLNPSWNIPYNIARKEILPKVKKDTNYLPDNNITVLTGWGDTEEIIDPYSIDWSEISVGTFRYRFRQEPGPDNPLGRIKFMFPNKFDIYLHDSPHKQLFTETMRTFSHGCIRIEKPVELAKHLLHNDPQWTGESILNAINKGTQRTVTLPEPINVHILYLTSWVDEDGIINFRKDIYGRDKRLDKTLTNHSVKFQETNYL